MFQQNGNHEVHAGANFKKHLSSMSVKELKAELDAIFEREESAGVKADPELIAEYITAIEELETDKCSQAQSYEEFEKTWSNFTKNHPDLFPPPETKPQKRSMHIGRFVEAAVLAATLLVVSVTAFSWPDHIVHWGKELLGISPPPSGVLELVEPNTDGYSTLAEAATGVGLEDVKTPTWIPARFSMKDIAIQELASYTMVTAVYASDESEFVIRISYYPDTASMPNFGFEKNDDDKQEEVKKDGITYWITENFDVLRVTWKDGNCLYSTLGMISRDEMDQVVNSFYGG